MANTRVSQSPNYLKSVSIESIQEPGDLDEIGADEVDEQSIKEAVDESKALFAKSLDIRRRIEEMLEVKTLRDELGLDDFDL